MRRPVTVFALLLASAILGACLDESITGTRPLTFSMSADPQAAAVGDSITFEFEATGTSIFGVIVAFGDGVTDTARAETSSLVQWVDQFTYAYETAGTYEVIGRVDTPTGSRADTLEVEISEGS